VTAKQSAAKKYIVRLSIEHRERLNEIIQKGKGPARRLLKARVLLKADASDAGEGWSDMFLCVAISAGATLEDRQCPSSRPARRCWTWRHRCTGSEA